MVGYWILTSIDTVRHQPVPLNTIIPLTTLKVITMQIEIKDFKATKKLVASIRKRTANLDLDIHTAAVSGLAHYKEHNDGSILTDLVKAVSVYNIKSGKFDGRSIRGAALRKWMEDLGGVKWSKKAYGKEGGYVADAKGITRADIDISRAMEVPFWAYTNDEVPEAKEVSPLDMMRQVRDQIRKIAAGESERKVFSDANMANAASIVNGITSLLASIEASPQSTSIAEQSTTENPQGASVEEENEVDEVTRGIAELMARAS